MKREREIEFIGYTGYYWYTGIGYTGIKTINPNKVTSRNYAKVCLIPVAYITNRWLCFQISWLLPIANTINMEHSFSITANLLLAINFNSVQIYFYTTIS